jgi:hypothetical protein
MSKRKMKHEAKRAAKAAKHALPASSSSVNKKVLMSFLGSTFLAGGMAAASKLRQRDPLKLVSKGSQKLKEQIEKLPEVIDLTDKPEVKIALKETADSLGALGSRIEHHHGSQPMYART